MSLISVRNFVAPFTNTTHIVTIILFTVLFALFRMQGGKLSVESTGRERNRSDAPAAETSRTSTGSSRFGADAVPSELLPSPNRRAGPAARAGEKPLPEEGTVKLSPEEESDLITQMIGKQPQGGEADKPKEAPAARRPKSGSGGSFEDIERSLGIR